MEYQMQDFKIEKEKDGTIEFSFLLEDKGPLPVATDKDTFTFTGSAQGFVNGQLKIAGAVKLVAPAPAVVAVPVGSSPVPPPAPPAPKP